MAITGIRFSVEISTRDVSDEDEAWKIESFINTFQAWAELSVREIRANGWMGSEENVTSEITRATRSSMDHVIYQSEAVVSNTTDAESRNSGGD